MLLRKFLPTALALALATSMSSLTAAAPAEILLSHQLDEERAERVEKVVERFNGSQKDYQVKLVRRVQGEPATDLNLVTREEQGHYVAAKAAFKPIQQIMTEAGIPFDGSKIAPELRVGLTDAKGGLAALPLGLSTPILFINKSAFRKAGLDPEKPPKTWAEVQQAADKLFDAGSKCPYTTSWPAWVHIDNLSAWNGVEVADAKGRLIFNGLPQVKHTALLTTWAKARFFIYFGRRDEADRRFAEGECGMLTSSSRRSSARCTRAARWTPASRRCRITTMCRERRSRRWPVVPRCGRRRPEAGRVQGGRAVRPLPDGTRSAGPAHRCLGLPADDRRRACRRRQQAAAA
jgi:sn-glycerol 3-phosphate transport system substrate-binding protein